MWHMLQTFAQQVVVQVLIPLALLLVLMLASIVVSWLAKHLNQAWAEKAWQKHLELIQLLVAAAEQHPALQGKPGSAKRKWVASRLIDFLGARMFDPKLFDVLVEAAVHNLKSGQQTKATEAEAQDREKVDK